MSTVQINLKHSPHPHVLLDVTPERAADIETDWVTGKGRVIRAGGILYARDAIAWIKITEEPPRPGVWVQGADSWVKIAD